MPLTPLNNPPGARSLLPSTPHHGYTCERFTTVHQGRGRKGILTCNIDVVPER